MAVFLNYCLKVAIHSNFSLKKWTFGAKKWRFIQIGAQIKSGVLFARIWYTQLFHLSIYSWHTYFLQTLTICIAEKLNMYCNYLHIRAGSGHYFSGPGRIRARAGLFRPRASSGLPFLASGQHYALK